MISVYDVLFLDQLACLISFTNICDIVDDLFLLFEILIEWN